MQTINKTQALDIFRDNLDEIKTSCEENLQSALNSLKQPSINKSYNHLWIENELHKLETRLLKEAYEPTIRRIEGMKKQVVGEINDSMIVRAKEHPIADILNVNPRGNISCPFHQDKKPSFQIKKNNTYTCYSCGDFGDAIDLYRKLNNTDFISAVKALS